MSNSTNATTEFAPPWVHGPDGRGTWQIIWSNLLTLGLCVIVALHLNIPPTGTTELGVWLRKSRWIIVAIVFPEMMLYSAGKQWFTANKLRKNLNRSLPASGADPRCSDVESGFHSCAPTQTSQAVSLDHSKKPYFGMTYAYYAVMGGFVADVRDIHDSLSQLTITPKGITFLAKHGHSFQLPEDSIQDKSKADLLAKALVCIQVTWHLVQVSTRWATGLSVSLLEGHVFIHVACALTMYVLWLRKPLDVRVPTRVDASSFQDLLALMVMRNYGFGRRAVDGSGNADIQIRATDYLHHDGSEASYLHVYPNSSDKFQPESNSNEPTANDQHGSSSFTSRVITPSPAGGYDFSSRPPEGTLTVSTLISGQSLAHGIGPAKRVCPLTSPSTIKHENHGRLALSLSERDVRRWSLVAHALERTGEQLHRPQGSVNYFTPSAPNILLVRTGVPAGFSGCFRAWAHGYTGGLIGALFACALYGAAHMVAWNYGFPTPLERVLWRTACVDTVLGWISLLALFAIVIYLREHSLGSLLRAFGEQEPGWLPFVFRLLVLAGLLNVPLFFASRMYITVETFLSLRHVAAGVYQTVSWTSYIPHF